MRNKIRLFASSELQLFGAKYTTPYFLSHCQAVEKFCLSPETVVLRSNSTGGFISNYSTDSLVITLVLI